VTIEIKCNHSFKHCSAAHGTSNAKVMGSIPREYFNWSAVILARNIKQLNKLFCIQLKITGSEWQRKSDKFKLHMATPFLMLIRW